MFRPRRHRVAPSVRPSRARLGESRWLALVPLLLLQACAPAARAHTESSQLLVVENGHFDDVRVALDREGTRILLGVVPGLSRRTFRLDPGQRGASAAVRLVAWTRDAQPLELRAELPLHPGGRAGWTLLQGLHHGTLVVR